jgi:hypothetical protein
MKGFEVRFRGETVRIAVDEPISLSIIVQKVRGKLDMSVHGWLMDADTHPVWMLADDLKQGDEIIIERKEVEQSSTPLSPPPDFDPEQLLSPKQIQEMWQYKLQYFRKLENVLWKEGLIDND